MVNHFIGQYGISYHDKEYQKFQLERAAFNKNIIQAENDNAPRQAYR